VMRGLLALLLAASLVVATIPRARAESAFPAKADARIVISQDQQRMLIYERGVLVKSLPISTGWPGRRETITPTWRGPVGEYWGTFSSFGTTQDDGYWLFTDYLPDGRWNGDILIHGAPYLVGPDGEKQYDLAGIGTAPVSHGCIRLLPEDMAWFRNWDPEGVEVEIEPLRNPAFALPKMVLGALLLSGTPVAQGR
jgi:lipoprotein-anchoring transpeptidase ErfK/SrfK